MRYDKVKYVSMIEVENGLGIIKEIVRIRNNSVF